jgi:hypothetical protein
VGQVVQHGSDRKTSCFSVPQFIFIRLFPTSLGLGGGCVQWLPFSDPGTGKQVRVQVSGTGNARRAMWTDLVYALGKLRFPEWDCAV